jgi:hypothetical protein
MMMTVGGRLSMLRKLTVLVIGTAVIAVGGVYAAPPLSKE